MNRGGLAARAEVIKFKADFELITTDQIHRAWDRVIAKHVRDCLVIDMPEGAKV